MTIMWIVIGALLIALAILLARSQRQRGEAARALHDLLQARAAGKIDEQDFLQGHAAIEARLRAGPPALMWLGLVAGLGLLGAVGYWLATPAKTEAPPVSGMPLAPPKFPLTGKAKPAEIPAMPAAQGNAGDLSVMAKRLADKLAKDPGNGEGWLLLARTYGEIRQPKEAAEAYAKAAAMVPLDATALADWADAQVMANGRRWNAEARKTVERALKAEPKQLKALALAGSEAFERADYKSAIDYWQRLRAAAPPDSMDAKLAEANIQEAEAMRAGKKPLDRIMDSAPARN